MSSRAAWSRRGAVVAGPARPWGVACLGLLASGCFVDAIGSPASDGGAGGAAQTTSSSSSAGETTTSQTSTSSQTSAVSTGGMGAGGEGGQGGAPCPDHALELDGDDLARFNDEAVDISDDFSFGAWVYPVQPPGYQAMDGELSFVFIIDHADVGGHDGYLLGFGEATDDGKPVAAVFTYPFGSTCTAQAAIGWNKWVHLAARYNDDIGGDDLFLYVDGLEAESTNCSAPPPVGYDGDLVLGGYGIDQNQFFVGAIDDVYVKKGGPVADIDAPLTCDGLVAAFDFEAGLSSLCATPSITFSLDAPPADPEITCGP